MFYQISFIAEKNSSIRKVQNEIIYFVVKFKKYIDSERKGEESNSNFIGHIRESLHSTACVPNKNDEKMGGFHLLMGHRNFSGRE